MDLGVSNATPTVVCMCVRTVQRTRKEVKSEIGASDSSPSSPAPSSHAPSSPAPSQSDAVAPTEEDSFLMNLPGDIVNTTETMYLF